ncbi:MAG: TetR/AcrR family transcriptional regulator [Bdellovibrionota bacterium]
MSAQPERKIGGFRARSKEAKEETRERILKAAIALYAEMGYEKFSVRKLAERTGYTPRALYSYYKNKDEIVAAVAQDGFEKLARYLDVPSADFAQYLSGIGRAYLRFATENPDLYRLLFMSRPPGMLDVDKVSETVGPAIFARLRENLKNLGLLDDASREAGGPAQDILWGLAHGLASLTITLPYFTPERMNAAFDFLVKNVEPPLRMYFEMRKGKK